MTIKGKIIAAAAVPMVAMTVFTAAIYCMLNSTGKVVDQTTGETFMPIIREEIPQLVKLDESVRLLLNADRDAYQAHLAEVKLLTAESPEQVAQLRQDQIENLAQVTERIGKASAAFDESMAGLQAEFAQSSQTWERQTRQLIDQAAALVNDQVERQKDLDGALSRFGMMREQLNLAGDTLKVRIDAPDTDPQLLRRLENSYGLLLNADRDLYQAYTAQLNLIRETREDRLQPYADEYLENTQQVLDRLDQAKDVFTPEILAYYDAFLKEYEVWNQHSQRIVSSSVKNAALLTERNNTSLKGIQAFEVMRDVIDRMGQALESQIESRVQQMDERGVQADVAMKALVQKTRTAKLYSLAFFGVIAASVTVILVMIVRGVVQSLRRIIRDLAEGAEQVSGASGQVSAASQSLAEGATEQAAGLEETSSSLEEMSSMTRQNADNAQQANGLATEARQAAEGGAEAMERMSRAIDDIQKSSDETAKIIKVIDEIAFQTNLLALNAAVEAARAGEAGKGFAVVAEEVRNLAMRSAEAAKNTANMIEGSVKNAKNGVEISGEVSKALHEIVDGIRKTTDLVGEIAAASQEQAQGIDQVNTAVAQMDKVTQQNAANAEESASASEELSAQAEQMKGIVSDLIALVDGSAGQRTDFTPIKKQALKLSDQPYHQIAGKATSGTAATERKKAAQAIPLDEDFKEFTL